MNDSSRSLTSGAANFKCQGWKCRYKCKLSVISKQQKHSAAIMLRNLAINSTLNNQLNSMETSCLFTLAVGIWTMGVGSRPGAEGCMAEGCIGRKPP